MRRASETGGFGLGRLWGALAVATLLASLVGCGEKKAPKVQIFSPESGAFTCDLPGSPTVTTETIATPSGAIEVKAYTVTKSEVEYAAKDAAIPQGVAADALLDIARNEIVKSSGGKLLNENKLTLGDVPCRELTIELADGVYSHLRLYVVQGRLFQTSVKVKSKYISPVANKFFGSIKWTKDTADEKGAAEKSADVK